jgi:uncharacterized metal-binding protein
MASDKLFPYYVKLAFEKNTFHRSIRVAVLVGIILNLINNSTLFLLFPTRK